MNGTTITGGIRIGESYWQATNYSRPLATFTVSESALVLKMPFKELVINRGEVIRISPYRGMMSDGIQIEHSSRNAPAFVVFWTAPSKVAKDLLTLGYPYQETNNGASSNPAHPKPSVLVTIFPLLGVFIAILVHERMIQRGLPDAILNATGLTLFLTVIVFVIRWRVFR